MRRRDTVRDWIPIADAVRRFSLSRATVFRLISSGKVAKARRAGDIRSYVSVADLKRLTQLSSVAVTKDKVFADTTARRGRLD